ncbi:glycosyltransferase family 4 protein [Paraburkholderia tagetis]|uniref:Glycosyltransferase family 4 protein n=1 Tax=Paraburkholderia tagetis TaxID=2913261 RepID=A0A9X1UGP7_9BURK|nr:glycosyltransferase family 4 protein [Paraburkholderia tagetis]MCG5072832.1 glycosyltransferase family 4 protein [Paraburkholderia tagetis]
MYPGRNRKNFTQGIFIEEQVESIRRIKNCQVDVFVIEGFGGKLAYLSSIFRVLRRVLAKKYDVVHYHFGISACSAPLVRLLTGASIVITFHGSDIMGGRLMREISLFFAKFSDACVAVSDEIKEQVLRVSGHCWVVPCAVNENLFSESDAVPRNERQQKIIVFPSSIFRPEKNYPLFEQTLEILRRDYRMDVIEKHIDGLGRSEVRQLLENADCLLMTSHREGSPQSIKESMAMNLPIVSVDVGDVRYLLGDCEGTAVVSDRVPATLASEVARFISAGRHSHGRARLKDLQYFSSDVAKKIFGIYEVLIKRKGGMGEGVTSDTGS